MQTVPPHRPAAGRPGLVAVVLAVALAVAVPAALTPVHAAAPPDAQTRRAAAVPPDVVALGVADLARLLSEGATSSVELTREYLRRVAAYEEAYAGQPGVNAVITVSPYALADAARLDAERAAGRVRGPLHGIPVLLKDNLDTGDLPTTAGSVALAGLQPPDDATQVERLRAAGAVVLAKTNLHELARGITTVSSLGGQTRNPYDQGRNPGGSSGGTAAGVAAAFAPVGLGTDTCGSIRYPAASTALVGLRPTQGLFSADGVVPLSRTQDVAGPLGRSAEDVALVLDATKGPDPEDPGTSVAAGNTPASFTAALSETALQGARVGILSDYFGRDGAAQREVSALVRTAVQDLAGQGAVVVEVGPQPALLAEVAAASVIGQEVERDLDAYLATPGLRLPAGLAARAAPADRATLADVVAHGGVIPSVLAALQRDVAQPPLPTPAYEAALARRAAARERLGALLAELDLDALAYPTLRLPPAPTGQSQPGGNCALASVTGFPAVTVPARPTAGGLPVGLELLGAPFSDPRLLAYAHDYSRAVPQRVPPPTTPPLPTVGCDPAASSPFTDTPPPHDRAIACLAARGIASGVSAEAFRPGAAVTRGQLATLVVRALRDTGVSLPPAPPDAFADDDGSVHEPALDTLAALGVLSGTAPGRSDLAATVSRGQAASVLTRALGEALYVVPAARLDAFPDDTGSVHEPALNALASFGVLRGAADGRAAEFEPLTRGQAATLVAGALLGLRGSPG